MEPMMNTKGYREYEVAAEWNGTTVTVRVHDDASIQVGDEQYALRRREGHAHLVDVIHGDIVTPAVVRLDHKGYITISLQGYMYQVAVTDRSHDQWYAIVRAGSQAAVHRVVVKAPMPGLLKSRAVQVGESVRKGQNLFVLEAMKMENAIKAPASGTIVEMSTVEGSAVEKGAVLCVVDTTAQ